MIHRLRVVSAFSGDVETGVVLISREESAGKPVYCAGGVRHRGGASSVRARVRNVGTWSPGGAGFRSGIRWLATGRTASGRNRKWQSTEAGSRLGSPHSSDEAR